MTKNLVCYGVSTFTENQNPNEELKKGEQIPLLSKPVFQSVLTEIQVLFLYYCQCFNCESIKSN